MWVARGVRIQVLRMMRQGRQVLVKVKEASFMGVEGGAHRGTLAR